MRQRSWEWEGLHKRNWTACPGSFVARTAKGLVDTRANFIVLSHFFFFNTSWAQPVRHAHILCVVLPSLRSGHVCPWSTTGLVGVGWGFCAVLRWTTTPGLLRAKQPGQQWPWCVILEQLREVPAQFRSEAPAKKVGKTQLVHTLLPDSKINVVKWH